MKHFTGFATKSLAAGFGFASLLAIAVPAPLTGQSLSYDRTTFVHGFGSDDSLWFMPRSGLYGKSVIQYLREDRRIDMGPRGTEGMPSLDPAPLTKPRRFGEQRDSLGQYVAERNGRHVLVGHSMGGLLSRSLYINDVARRAQMSGIVTVASPHQGADIAVYAPRARKYFEDTQRTVNDGIKEANQLLRWGAIFTTVIGTVLAPSGLSLFAWIGTFLLVDKISNAEITDEDVKNGVSMTYLKSLGDLPPADVPKYRLTVAGRVSGVDPELVFTYIEQLNSSTDDAAVPRANVYADLGTSHGAVIHLANTHQNTEQNTQRDIRERDNGRRQLEGCQKYSFFLFMSGKSNRCGRAAQMLKNMDQSWLMFTTGIIEARVTVPPAFCALVPQCRADGFLLLERPVGGPFDAVVPNARSKYPGLTDPAANFRVVGRNHVNINRHRDGVDQTGSAMRRIGMREEPVQTVPLTSVNLRGPMSLIDGRLGTWSASPAGGVAPFRYQWSVNGDLISDGSADSFTFRGGSTMMTISVTVIDAAGTSVDAYMEVYSGDAY